MTTTFVKRGNALEAIQTNNTTGGVSITSANLAVTTPADGTIDVSLTTDQQNALNLANTALQVETDPTVDSKVAAHDLAVNAHQNLFNGKVDITGDTMTGALILNGAPTTDMMAVNKKYVDDMIGTEVSTSFIFAGFISGTAPTTDVREGNRWLQITLPADTAPSTTFPWSVQIYTSGAWGTPSAYTPTAFDLWYDVDNKEAWYYLGGVWERLDYGGNTFDPNKFSVNNGVVTIKPASISNADIATNAQIEQVKIKDLIANLAGKISILTSGAGNVPVIGASGQLENSGIAPGGGVTLDDTQNGGEIYTVLNVVMVPAGTVVNPDAYPDGTMVMVYDATITP